MPAVIFYLLNSANEQQRLAFVCNWVQKLYRSHQTAYIVVGNSEQAAQLDQLLWTFSEDSFIPHQRYNGQLPLLPHTFLIGEAPIPETRQRLVFNLSSTVPTVGASCEKLYEIADNDTAWLEGSRMRYRHYQQHGMPPEKITIK